MVITKNKVLETTSYNELTIEFIREFKDKLDWHRISMHQKLTPELIREFKDELDWYAISMHQKLTPELIREFKDKLKWCIISEYQKLTPELIREFKDKLDWFRISEYQKLTPELIREFKDKLDLPKTTESSWLYATKDEKLEHIKKLGVYEIIDDEYLIAYKTVRQDGHSVFNFQYLYEVGKVYSAINCDCNLLEGNSFGISAWTQQGALDYYAEGRLLKVKVYIDDVGAIVRGTNKLRCWKLEVIEEVIEAISHL